MSFVLYYKNKCEFTETLLAKLAKLSIPEYSGHFICVDKRKRGADKKIYVILPNGQELVMPEVITSIPSLLILPKCTVLTGNDIYKYFSPPEKTPDRKSIAEVSEPEPFSFSSMESTSALSSDKYSYYNQDDEPNPQSNNTYIQNSNSGSKMSEKQQEMESRMAAHQAQRKQDIDSVKFTPSFKR